MTSNASEHAQHDLLAPTRVLVINQHPEEIADSYAIKALEKCAISKTLNHMRKSDTKLGIKLCMSAC